MATAQSPAGAIRKSGARGYHQSWYALTPSADIPAGTVKGFDFLGSRAVVYRGEDGRAHVMSGFCRHLGADMSLGKVVGSDIRCAFHHWQYGPDGGCTRIPAADSIPKAARLFSFPTAEKWGLIWAFNGDTPLFDVPEFVGFEESALDYRTVVGFDLPVEPWVPFTNSMDFQHLRIVHGLKVDCDPDQIDVGKYRIQYDTNLIDPQLGEFNQRIRVTGTNTIALTGKLGGFTILSMATGTPTVEGRTHGWMITATPLAEGSADERRARIEMGEAFFQRLIKEDEPIMSSIRFREGVLIDADRALARFFQYLKRFPTNRLASRFA
jgi:nitrite reductase/ring-hydroxylating ferredoxin subunit